MNGTGLKDMSIHACKHLYTLQPKLLLVSSALAPCIYAPEDLSRGNGMAKYDVSPTYNSYFTFLQAYDHHRDAHPHHRNALLVSIPNVS